MRIVLAGIAVLISLSAAWASPFEPMFRVVRVVGECTVKAPSDSDFQAIKDGKAYPYGTQIRTGRRSSLLVELSAGNECRVLANADIVVAEDMRDSKLKVVKLNLGRVDVELEDGFEESGDKFQVETPTAICGAIGCKFGADTRSEQEMMISAFPVEKGKVRIFGADFEIPLVEKDDLITVANSHDRTYIRIKNVKGSFDFTYRDSSGNPKTVELKEGSIVKIWRRPSHADVSVVVTILITLPNGTILDSVTYTSSSTQQAFLDLQSLPGQEPPPAQEGGEIPAIQPLPVVSSPTTTSRPPVTPVGLQ